MKNFADLLFYIGFIIILVTTFALNIAVGCYLFGTLAMAGAVIMAKNDPEK